MPACVLLVLAGLFGMHGLSGHGMSSDNAAMTDNAGAMMGPIAAAAAGHAAHQAPGSTEFSVAQKLQPANDHGRMGDMAAGLCLAILAGLLLGLAVWLSAHRRRPLFEELLRLVPLPRPRGRDPDPPSPDLLSVWRC